MSMSLEGLKILDLTRVLAGPYCTMILADLGAEVIKVEAPGGSDETRDWGPPFQHGVSAYYLCANRNKKSITIDLKSSNGIKYLKEIIKESDVIVNNFKTGTMERFGLDYQTLSTLNPSIIYASITGFGETGPYKDMPGYDFIIQAMSGLMSITGNPESGPQKVGIAITDVLTGLYTCIGIQAALLERQHSGKGQKIDISLYDTAVSSLVNVASNYLMSSQKPKLLGNSHPNIVPYQTFKTKDRDVVIAVGNDAQFKRLCHILQLDYLSNDNRFRTNASRVQHRDLLIPLLQESLTLQTSKYWIKALQEEKIPCGPIQTIDNLPEDLQLKSREMFVSMHHQTAGPIKLIGNPLKLSRTPVTYRHAPPNPGEHNNDYIHLKGDME
ncbi:CoA transferase [Oceanobacillus sp. E9]|uniref:CaiB/BaiF CoA transferase family protein n=1 Tax=Oceanobacillus sp. E9 TaxID=1742575 RepID=UPI000A07C1E5|nr:CoA transferase [Oceanobacillus sp. E9]